MRPIVHKSPRKAAETNATNRSAMVKLEATKI